VIKKLGVVTVGVAAGLMVAAPFASASESHHDGDHHDKKRGHESSDCNVVGGEAEANGGIEGDALVGNLLAQAPIGGNNILNITCNEILNDNLSDNDVAISVLGAATS
jgi:hypothetical protein